MITENQRIVYAQITEKTFQESVRQLAILRGWKGYHVWDPRHTPKGWPDCVLLRGCRIIVAELKTMTGKVSVAQQEWLDAWRTTGVVEVYVWRPCDMEAIERILE